MTEAISTFVSELFKDNVILATILIAIIPLIELKGAIPFGMSIEFWKESALDAWPAFFYAFLGGVVVTIILTFIFKPIYNAVKDKKFFKRIMDFFTASVKNKTEEISTNTKEQSGLKKTIIKMITVFLWVAIPVPGTGVYTGTCLAVFLDLKWWQTLISVTLGNFVAGIIIMTICEIFPQITTILFYVFIGIILALLIYKVIVHFINKKQQNVSLEQDNENKKEV